MQAKSVLFSIAEMLERWTSRRENPHIQRAYRKYIASLLAFMGFRWPEGSLRLMPVTVGDVQRWRDQMLVRGDHIVCPLEPPSGAYHLPQNACIFTCLEKCSFEEIRAVAGRTLCRSLDLS